MGSVESSGEPVPVPFGVPGSLALATLGAAVAVAVTLVPGRRPQPVAAEVAVRESVAA